MHRHRQRPRTRCPGFDLLQIGPDGVFSRAAHFGADGGDPGLGALVNVGSGALVDVWAWHGGPSVATIYAPHGQPAADPPFPLSSKKKECRPPFERGFTGTELVTLCPDDYAAKGERCFVDGLPVDDGTCDRVHIVRLEDGRPITPARGAPLIFKRVRCHHGRPVLEVGWKGGQRRLDPHAPGASLDLARDLGIWTGSHALFFADDGAIARHTCTRDGRLVPAEPDSG